MMTELYLAALEQRMSSRLRIALAVFVNLIAGFGMGDILPFGIGMPIVTALVVSAGILGKEFSSGTPQLTFARPVTRAAYVLARWLACVTAMVGFTLVAVAVALLVPHQQGQARILVVPLLFSVLTGAGTCAVVVGLSGLSSGFADVVLLAAAGVFTGFLGGGANATHAPLLGRALTGIADTGFRLFYPALSVGGGLHAAITLGSAAGFAATVGGWLLVAIVAVSRREISYATD